MNPLAQNILNSRYGVQQNKPNEDRTGTAISAEVDGQTLTRNVDSESGGSVKSNSIFHRAAVSHESYDGNNTKFSPGVDNIDNFLTNNAKKLEVKKEDYSKYGIPEGAQECKDDKGCYETKNADGSTIYCKVFTTPDGETKVVKTNVDGKGAAQRKIGTVQTTAQNGILNDSKVSQTTNWGDW